MLSVKCSYLYICLLLFSFCIQVNAQDKSASPIDIVKLLQQNKVKAFNRIATVLPGDSHYKGIHLNEQPNMGILWLNDITFSNGTISLDIKGKDLLQKSFVGLAIHGINDTLFDAIYFRPFNFRAVDTVRKSHSVQYVSYPKYEWDVLRKNFPDKYEQAVTPAPDPNAWFHVRIVVKYPVISVFVNDSPAPCLVVNQLSHQQSGKIGLWVGNNAGGDFANLHIAPL